MNQVRYSLWSAFAVVISIVLSGFSSTTVAEKGELGMKVHYVEIVCESADAQCKAFESAYGLTFGPKEADLGGARVARAKDGSQIAVREPLAAHEEPIVRTYFAVDDIAKTLKAVEAEGAMIAYPATKQGDTGTWAIYILGGVQVGLWQR